MDLKCLYCGFEAKANVYALENDEVPHYCISCNNCKECYLITVQLYDNLFHEDKANEDFKKYYDLEYKVLLNKKSKWSKKPIIYRI